MHSELTRRTAQSLTDATQTDQALTAMIGLDAFVDEIIRVVDRRISPLVYSPVERLSDLSARIATAAGVGTNMELVVERVKLGGQGPIMANALAALGTDVTCVGPFGEGTLHPVFSELAERANVVSLGEPGHTDALEFEDGKLMLGKHESLRDVTWERLIERMGTEEVEHRLSRSNLVALINWTMLPAMNAIWEQALALLERTGATGTFFFDLADPEKHDNDAVGTACHLLARFQKYGPTILGLNEKEALRVADTLGYQGRGHGRTNVRHVAAFISQALPIATVVVHPRAYAVTASQGAVTAEVEGPFTDNPLISTGAGDHFNAGFCLGRLLGLPDDQAATAAVGTSGYYVRNAASPTLPQLAEFLASQAQPA
jgi:sugar/nucleoside kinase (ribokinase family)